MEKRARFIAWMLTLVCAAIAGAGCATYRTVTVTPSELHSRARELKESGPQTKVAVQVDVNDKAGYHTEPLAVLADSVVTYNGEPFVIRELVQDCVDDTTDRCWLVRNRDARLLIERRKETAPVGRAHGDGGTGIANRSRKRRSIGSLLLDLGGSGVLGGLVAIPVSQIDALEAYPKTQTGLEIYGGVSGTIVGGVLAWLLVDCLFVSHNCRD